MVVSGMLYPSESFILLKVEDVIPHPSEYKFWDISLLLESKNGVKNFLVIKLHKYLFTSAFSFFNSFLFELYIGNFSDLFKKSF